MSFCFLLLVFCTASGMVPYEFTNEMKTLYTVCPMYRFLDRKSVV